MISVKGNGAVVGLLKLTTGSAGLAAAGSGWRPERRFLVSLIPASIVTFGLFVAMTELVRVDEVTLVEKPQRNLAKITPQRLDSEPVRTIRLSAPLVDVLLPPLPPVLKTTSKADGPPMPVFQSGSIPVPREVINFPPPVPEALGERLAQAIRQPVPSYPQAMARKGQEGACEVHFSLTTRGLPYDVSATCSHAGFEKEAVRAVGRAEFLPEIRQGVPVESHNYVYPMEFRLQ